MMTPPSKEQWPRGPGNDLHRAACCGSVQRTIALLSRGAINIDQGDPTGCTPLMFATQEGHSRVARILLNKGANVSIVADRGITAMHLAAQGGNLAAALDLAGAGADVDAKRDDGATPLVLAARQGHSDVMAALIEAGANVDCSSEGNTALATAACHGNVDAVKELLRAKANPLGKPLSRGLVCPPLEAAASNGHSNVVRELIHQVGIEGCGGESGGVDALGAAATHQRVNIVAVLLDAGVVDSGFALHNSAGCGWVAVVKLLLQWRREGGTSDDGVGYANLADDNGVTPLFRSIAGDEDLCHLISPKVVRLLIDAGADTSSAVRITNSAGEVTFHDTPLAYASTCLCVKEVRGGKAATEEQMNRLEAVRRLLLRVEAVHAVSWSWLQVPLVVGCPAQVPGRKNATKRATQPSPLALMLPMLRHRKRGVLLAPLFRYSSYP